MRRKKQQGKQETEKTYSYGRTLEYFKDPFYINAVERIIGRKLSVDEMDGKPFKIEMPNGHYRKFCVPYIAFPDGLLSDPNENNDHYPELFEYAS